MSQDSDPIYPKTAYLEKPNHKNINDGESQIKNDEDDTTTQKQNTSAHDETWDFLLERTSPVRLFPQQTCTGWTISPVRNISSEMIDEERDGRNEEEEWPNGLFQPIDDDDDDLKCPPKKLCSSKQSFEHLRMPSYEREPIQMSTMATTATTSDKQSHTMRYLKRKAPDSYHCKTPSPEMYLTDTWRQRLHQLKMYKAEFGDCQVPQRYARNPQLGTWVNKQRNEYKLMTEGKKSSMTKERVIALESIGFIWANGMEQSIWRKHFEELKQYRKIHGNCLVPTRYKENPVLGRWVSSQRKNYKMMKEGKKTSMTSERLKFLNDLGFIWRLQF